MYMYESVTPVWLSLSHTPNIASASYTLKYTAAIQFHNVFKLMDVNFFCKCLVMSHFDHLLSFLTSNQSIVNSEHKNKNSLMGFVYFMNSKSLLNPP